MTHRGSGARACRVITSYSIHYTKLYDQIAAEFGRDPSGPKPFEGLDLIDIGCGGGLLSEPMARLGAKVTGIDAAARNIPVAEAHARQMGLEISYNFV